MNAATSGANGLDTGTLAASTWYYLWFIGNGTTISSLLSLSSTTPTLPSGYTYKFRVGSVRTTSGTIFPRFIQYNEWTQYINTSNTTNTQPLLLSGTTGTAPTTFTAIAVSTSVPPTASVINVQGTANGAGAYLLVAPNASYNNYNTPAASAPFMIYNVTASASGWPSQSMIMVLESTNIYVLSSGTSNKLYCFGYTDNL